MSATPRTDAVATRVHGKPAADRADAFEGFARTLEREGLSMSALLRVFETKALNDAAFFEQMGEDTMRDYHRALASKCAAARAGL